MKKLMIAAAAMAMIGGAEAKVAVYDFVANLVTTVGEAGENQWSYDELKIGQDATGKMWYSDTTILTNTVVDKTTSPWSFVTPTDFPHLRWTTTTSLMNGTTYPTLTIVRGADSFGENGEEINFLLASEATFLKNLERAYPLDSYGIHCYEPKFWTKVNSVCYRVTGADQINMKIGLDTTNCCVASFAFCLVTNNYFDAAAPVVNYGTTGTTEVFPHNGIRNGFAAPVESDARGIEIYAHVGNEDLTPNVTRRQTYLDPTTMQPSENTADGDTWVSTVNTVSGKLPFAGWLAGQGWQQNQDGVNNLPITITGNIVGYTEAPECIDCCVRPLPKALAFPCEVLTDASPNATVYRPNTAAFGAFYIQYAGMID